MTTTVSRFSSKTAIAAQSKCHRRGPAFVHALAGSLPTAIPQSQGLALSRMLTSNIYDPRRPKKSSVFSQKRFQLKREVIVPTIPTKSQAFGYTDSQGKLHKNKAFMKAKQSILHKLQQARRVKSQSPVARSIVRAQLMKISKFVANIEEQRAIPDTADEAEGAFFKSRKGLVIAKQNCARQMQQNYPGPADYSPMSIQSTQSKKQKFQFFGSSQDRFKPEKKKQKYKKQIQLPPRVMKIRPTVISSGWGRNEAASQVRQQFMTDKIQRKGNLGGVGRMFKPESTKGKNVIQNRIIVIENTPGPGSYDVNEPCYYKKEFGSSFKGRHTKRLIEKESDVASYDYNPVYDSIQNRSRINANRKLRSFNTTDPRFKESKAEEEHAGQTTLEQRPQRQCMNGTVPFNSRSIRCLWEEDSEQPGPGQYLALSSLNCSSFNIKYLER